jgi:hypothetical protein
MGSMLHLLVLVAQGATAIPGLCDLSAEGADQSDVHLQWEMFSSEWGAYKVDGCDAVNPKLFLSAGKNYTFHQTHASNWYHPVGFAFIAGGAHTECKDATGSLGECPELEGDMLQYYIDGVPGSIVDGDFGLDAYEPEFFNSQDWWGEKEYTAILTIPADVTYTKFYYFCHIHSGMSAEIEIVDHVVTPTAVINPEALGGETEASALAIYDNIVATEQESLSDYDASCGTHNSEAFGNHSTCSNKNFVCGPGASTDYGQCLAAVDCQMHHNMAVSMPASASRFATFARQMIPHHQNAVAMAKVLAMYQGASDYPPDGTEDQDMAWANGLIRNIINVQNFQIQQMQAWLDANPTLAGTSTNCYDNGAAGSTCGEVKAAYQMSECCGADLSNVTPYVVS